MAHHFSKRFYLTNRLSIAYTCIIIIFHTAAYSQRYDFNWIFGYDGGGSDLRFGNTKVDFNTGNPLITFIPEGRLFILTANASISDSAGNFLYSANGYDVIDRNYKKVLGATNLGTRYWPGLIYYQGVLFLPIPGDTNKVIFLYPNLILNSPFFYTVDMRYLILDKIENKTIKTQIFLKDTVNEGCLAANKHANGMDWWIILMKKNTNIFFKFLLNANGMILIDTQSVGPIVQDGFGQASFSNNGDKLLLLEAVDYQKGMYVYYYQFDRCTGKMEFEIVKNYWLQSFPGISFSPNGKYVYLSDKTNLYQIEVNEPGSWDFPTLVDTISDQTLPWGSQFLFHQPGPDGRIYICNAYTNFAQHVIDKPNEEGIACQSRPNGLILKTLNGKGIPNFPNYRLGPIDGSSCDTLGIDNIPWAWWRHDQDTTDHLRFEFTDLSAYEVTEWQWSFGDGVVTQTQHPVHRFEKNGVYEVCLIAKNKNGVDTLCKTLNVGTTSVDDKEKAVQLELFPNPFEGYFILNVLNYSPENMYVQVFNSQGQILKSQKLFEGSNMIDTESLQSGSYVLQIFERSHLVKRDLIIKM